MKTDKINTKYQIIAEYEIERYKGERTLISCDDSRMLNLCIQLLDFNEFRASVLEKLNDEIAKTYPDYFLGEPPKMGIDDITSFKLKVVLRHREFTFEEYKQKFFECTAS